MDDEAFAFQVRADLERMFYAHMQTTYAPPRLVICLSRTGYGKLQAGPSRWLKIDNVGAPTFCGFHFIINDTQKEDYVIRMINSDDESDSNDLINGVWFRSAVTSGWYRSRGSAGTVDAVAIDGIFYWPRLSEK